jgi:hypothetical protein
MRAWTIVVFIIAIHAVLAMINVANITDVGLNISLDTSGGGVLITPGTTNITVPSSVYFNESANGSDIANKSIVLTGTTGNFFDKAIEQIIGAANTFIKLMGMLSSVLFSIHTMGAPIFGDFNAWVLEGMVDIIFGISLFQMITGRSFKTME